MIWGFTESSNVDIFVWQIVLVLKRIHVKCSHGVSHMNSVE